MNTENDQQLDDKQLSALYKHVQHDMPPAHLDETILKAAKKSLRPRPLNPFNHSWRVSAALAAVLVLSVGIVTLMDDVDIHPASEGVPAFIENDRLFDQPEKEMTSPLESAPATISVETQDSDIRQGLIAEKKLKLKQRKQLSKRSSADASRRLIATDRPNIDSIKALRLAGNIPLANKKADLFVRYYFGNELNKVIPEQVTLSTKDWKAIISELKELDRTSIAIKLEKLLMQREQN